MNFRCMRNTVLMYTRGVSTDFPTSHENLLPKPVFMQHMPRPCIVLYSGSSAASSTSQSTMASCSQPPSIQHLTFGPLPFFLTCVRAERRNLVNAQPPRNTCALGMPRLGQLHLPNGKPISKQWCRTRTQAHYQRLVCGAVSSCSNFSSASLLHARGTAARSSHSRQSCAFYPYRGENGGSYLQVVSTGQAKEDPE